MDRFEISSIAHADHPIAAPVSQQRAEQLVGRLSPPLGGSVLDLGCGPGAWLFAAGRARPDLTLRGVDVSAPALASARSVADERGVEVDLVLADAASWTGDRHDAVMCVGASHVFGGLEGTLDTVRGHLRPGGRALIGDGIWEQPPSEAAQRFLGAGPDDYPDLAGLVSRALGREFEVIDGHVSTIEEWDDYEWAWTGALVRWALDQDASSAGRAAALEAARAHRDAWLEGYRKHLGFAFLVLQDLRAPA